MIPVSSRRRNARNGLDRLLLGCHQCDFPAHWGSVWSLVEAFHKNHLRFHGFWWRGPSLCVDDKLSGSPSVGICQTYEWPAADEDACAVFETAAGLIDKAGGHLSEVTLPEEFRHLTDAQALIADFEAANSAAYELNSRRDSVSKSYLERAETGLSYTEKQYDDALSVVTRAQNSFDAVMEGVDVLLCPSATGQAPEGLDATGNPIFNRLGTALKGPCVNIPGLSGHSGLPVGVQLIGRIKDDRQILATADWMHGILQRR